eukprot:CAMPEP_0198505888 /NCGR_PEP_ID=MMETSP1462-20131121/11321_1 /TAXON_ID=1333877 /ORGANISM="Brandtodinium nutriculum, Strain RCC3387" /LENGTH=51 /DNA_ID=CAMNT_0044235083 /DNA_START=1 /DNA_END=152 /DNA_ORIENTATION=+
MVVAAFTSLRSTLPFSNKLEQTALDPARVALSALLGLPGRPFPAVLAIALP